MKKDGGKPGSLISRIRNECGGGDWIYWSIIMIGLGYLLFLFPGPEYPALNKDDGALFLTLAINIAEYGRYTMDTTGQADYGLHATWPPAYPVFLASLISLFGVSWLAIKIGMVTTGFAVLVVLWRLWSTTTPGRLAVLLTAISPYFFLYCHHSMAEIPYMLGVALTLLLLDRSTSRRQIILAGLVGAIAFLTRGYAVMLLPCGIIFLLMGSYRPIKERLIWCTLFSGPMLLAILAWAGYTNYAIASGNIDGFTAVYGNGTGILSGLLNPSPLDHLRRFYWHDSRYSVFLMLPIVNYSTVQTEIWPLVVSIFLLGLATFGWVRSFSGRVSSAAIWVPAKIAILWAVSPSVRYWIPLLPYLFFYTLFGIYYIANRTRNPRLLSTSLVGALLTSGILGLISHLLKPDDLRFFDRYGVESRDIILWARDHLPPDAVVITEAPGDVFSAAGRRSFSLNTATDQWPPTALKNQTDLYLLCPTTSEARTHYPKTYENCMRLRQQLPLLAVKELPLIGLYRIIPSL